MKRREENKNIMDEETDNVKSSNQTTEGGNESSTGEPSFTSSSAKSEEKSSGAGINFDFLNMFGKNFYDGINIEYIANYVILLLYLFPKGGFEDKMNKREVHR